MKMKLNQSKLKLAIASAIIAAGAAGLSATSYAATDTATMAVTTSVSMSCTITAGAMTFASYNPTDAADNDANATITSTCTTGGAAVITMGQGNRSQVGSSDAAPLRAMYNGNEGAPEDLVYQVYSDSAGGAVWGNTSDTGKSITADGTAQVFTAFGRIPKNQTVGAGSFSDSVAVTLTY
ncbi:spore coat U domain-containing protein [Pseudomonadales bacterium]|nr:spore coat U domain-containing protein [Pseudomonadales bacterium]